MKKRTQFLEPPGFFGNRVKNKRKVVFIMTFKSLFSLKANAIAYVGCKVGEKIGAEVGDKIVEVVDSIYGVYDAVDTVVTIVNVIRYSCKAYKMGKFAWQLYKATANDDSANV